MANKKITYGVGFKVDSAGLEKLKQELKRIQSLTAIDLQVFDPSLATKNIQEIDDKLIQLKKDLEE